MTITSRLSRAEHAVKAAFARADGVIAAMPDATISKHRGLGALIISAAHNAAFDPAAAAHSIAKTLQADVDAALDEINQAELEGEHLKAVADFLAGRLHALPDDMPTDLAAHAKGVKNAAAAGLVDAKAVAADVSRYTSEAQSEIKRLKSTFVDSTKSAVRVVSAKAAVAAFTRAGLPDSVRKAEVRLTRLKGIHKYRFTNYGDPSLPRVRHNTKWSAR